MEELEPKLEDIYARIRERRILLGHPLVYKPYNDPRKSFKSDIRYLVDGNGILPYKTN